MSGQEEADKALAEARKRHDKITSIEKAAEPLLKRIKKLADENAVYAKFVETLR